MRPVTDPQILQQLNGGLKPVTAPAILQQLNARPDLTKGGYYATQPSLLGSEMLGNVAMGAGKGLLDMYHGAKQIGGDMGLLDLPENFNQDVMAQNRAYAQSPTGQSMAGKTGEVVGAALPFMAIPAGPAGFMGRAALNAGLGATSGALQFVPPGGSRAMNTAVGGGVGAVAGPIADQLGGGVVRGINTLTGRLRPEAQELNALSKQFDVPLSVGDVRRGPVQPKVETALETVPFVGIGGFRQKQGQAAQNAAQGLRDRYAGQVAGDTAQLTQESLARKFRLQKDISGRNYQRMASLGGDTPVPTVKMNQYAADIIKRETQKKPEFQDKGLIELMTRYTVDPGQGFMALRDVRSDLAEEVSKYYRGQAQIGQRGVADIQGLKKSLDEDMGDYATQSGGQLKQAWAKYNKHYREKVRPYEDEADIRGALSSLNPDEIHAKFIKSGKRDRAQRFYDRMDNQGRAAVRLKILDDAMQKGLDSKAFSLNKFAGELERMDEASGVFFKGKDKQELDGLAKLMRRAERGGQYLENPPTGVRYTNIVGATGGAVGFGVEPTTLATSAAVVKGLSMLYTSRAGKRLLLSASKAKGGALDILLQKASRLAVVESVERVNQPRVEVGMPQMVR